MQPITDVSDGEEVEVLAAQGSFYQVRVQRALSAVVSGCRVTVVSQVRRRGVFGFIKRNYISFST